jgi:hypothetical protein
MARQEDKKTFDTALGKAEIQFTQLDGMTAGKLLIRIGRAIGPGIAALSGAVDLRASALGGLDLKGDGIAGAVKALFDNLTEAEFEHLARSLLRGSVVTVNGEAQDLWDLYGDLFRGNVFTGFVVIGHAIRVNYGNFTAALASVGVRIPDLRATIAKLTRSQNVPSASASGGQRNG